MNAEEIIINVINLFTDYLDELKDLPRNDFIHGEMTAYVETLELFQGWKDAKKHNLDYVIQKRYKI